jgi:predicted enzyme related to lactoylglutathione lyase
MRRMAPGQPPTKVVAVPSVERARAIVAAGGTLVAPKMSVPGVGWTAYVADPVGNAVGIMQFDTAAA